MSFDHLPPNIEQGVQRYANEMHITHDEALLELIQTGLMRRHPRPAPVQGMAEKPGTLLIGLFSSPADLAVFDEAMALSREVRDGERLRDVWQ